MTVPVHLHFKGMPTSDALTEAVHGWVEKLERVHDRIERCDVIVDVPHHHQQRGRAFRVVVKIAIPGNDVVVRHDGDQDDQDDPYLAVRDAFTAAQRKLSAVAERTRDRAHG